MLRNLIGGMQVMLAPDGAGSGSTEGGTPAPSNADLLNDAFGVNTDGGNADAGADGKKPADKPKEGDKNAGRNDPGSGDLKLSPWAEQLPAEYRNNPETAAKFAKFTKVGDMAKAWLELEGKPAGVVIPGKDASAEAVAEFWEKAGRPKAADGYSFAKDAENEGNTFAQAAFAANLTEAQAAAMLKNLHDIGAAKQKAYQEKMKQRNAETAAALAKEYGSKYAENMELLQRGLAAAGPNIAELLFAAGIAWEPDIIKAFVAFGKMTAESGFARGDGAGASLKSIEEGGSLYNS